MPGFHLCRGSLVRYGVVMQVIDASAKQPPIQEAHNPSQAYLYVVEKFFGRLRGYLPERGARNPGIILHRHYLPNDELCCRALTLLFTGPDPALREPYGQLTPVVGREDHT